jgi:hypothetical protein
LEGVARRSRRDIEGEAAAAEHDTELLRKRRRRLVDVCFEWMSRGDLVTIATGGHIYEGRLEAAINDLLIVATKTIAVAANLDRVDFVRSDRRAAFAGTTGSRTVSSFRAELGRYEVEGTAVRLIGTTFDLAGVITASTDDHVVVTDAQSTEWAIPRSKILCSVAAATESPG